MLKPFFRVVGLIFALIGIYMLSVSPLTKSLLSRYHLLPEPEKLTELYFENHLHLPTKLVFLKPLPFSFTIHNLEYQDMVYHWQVKAADDVSEVIVASGAAKLAQDQYQTIDTGVDLATASSRVQVQVTLLDQNQSIHFWLNK